MGQPSDRRSLEKQGKTPFPARMPAPDRSKYCKAIGAAIHPLRVAAAALALKPWVDRPVAPESAKIPHG